MCILIYKTWKIALTFESLKKERKRIVIIPAMFTDEYSFRFVQCASFAVDFNILACLLYITLV